MDPDIIQSAWGERWDLVGAAAICLTIVSAVWRVSGSLSAKLAGLERTAEHTADAIEHQATADRAHEPRHS